MRSTLLAMVLLAGAPALRAAEGYIMPWCNWQSGEIEVYEIPPIENPLPFTVDLKPFQIGPVQIKFKVPPWLKIPDTFPVPDLAKSKKIGTIPKDCKYLRDISLGHPYEMSDPVAKKIRSITTPLGAGKHADTIEVSQLNSFPYFVPLPLALPPRFDVPGAAISGDCDGSLGVYQVLYSSNRIVHIGLCPLALLKEIDVCSKPLETGLSPDGTTLLVTCYDNAIVWIDTTTDTVTTTFKTSAFPAGVAFSPDSTRAYVTNYYDARPDPAILVFDVKNKTLVQTIPLSRAFPGAIALTPDGSQAWVTYYRGTAVDVVDLATGTVAISVNMQENTQNGMAFNPTGTKAYIATGTNHLAVVDTATMRVLTKIEVTDFPLDVVMSPDGRSVLVGSYSTGLGSLVDTERDIVVQKIPVQGPAQGLGYIPGNPYR